MVSAGIRSQHRPRILRQRGRNIKEAKYTPSIFRSRGLSGSILSLRYCPDGTC
jgi:hypothetical protein